MRRHFFLCVISLLLSSGASSQEELRYALRGDAPTGSNIPELLARSTMIPLNKKYSELSDEQKAVLASHYERMGERDEPPFPVDGLAPIMRLLHRAQAQLLVTGPLYLIVDVGADGAAKEVKAIGSPSPEMTQLAASVLIFTKYKPAVCAGQPCRMQYPFVIEFRRQ
jgi:hypothetical protein